MNDIFRLLIIILCVLLLSGCFEQNGNNEQPSKGAENEIFIGAAASLHNVLTELKHVYEEEFNQKITISFQGSGKLAQQIEQGAPIDLFISANEDWMDSLHEKDTIEAESRTTIANNKLVLITHKDSSYEPFELTDLKKEMVETMALGHPDSVPAGAYVKDALQMINKWDELHGAFVYTKDVRQALTYVETKNAELGFVYASDAISSADVQVVAEVDETLHDEIKYEAALTKEARNRSEANKFLQFIQSKEHDAIFEKYGFIR